jgi:hypothetical protein
MPSGGVHPITHINAPRAALAADEPGCPIRHTHLGPVALGHLGRVRLDPRHHTIKHTRAAAALPSVIGGPLEACIARVLALCPMPQTLKGWRCIYL